MTDQPRPNWYDDGTGLQRWWDGRAWTKRTRAIPPAASEPAATAVLDLGPGAEHAAKATATATATAVRSAAESLFDFAGG